MFELWAKRFLTLTAMAIAICLSFGNSHNPLALAVKADPAETKAIEFLMREVPAWSKNNGCFSCHNNGDAARALYAASRKGYRIPAKVLADTTEWVSQPNRWDQNKGDPGFSDKRLANVQFAASLLAAFESGYIKDRGLIEQAARKLVADQSPDGAWKIDGGNVLGSPATYGTPLATWMALRTLHMAGSSTTKVRARKAEQWLQQTSLNNMLTAAVFLLVPPTGVDKSFLEKQAQSLSLIRKAQTRDGGWGPYPDSPPEPFDTAVVLLALAQSRRDSDITDLIRRGRNFLVSVQNPDGSWPATTRPPGGDSYAQMISTTGWATLALLETREKVVARP